MYEESIKTGREGEYYWKADEYKTVDEMIDYGRLG